MLKPFFLVVAGALAGCQATPPATADATATTPATTATAPITAAPVTTEAAARAAVAHYLQTLPTAALFVPDSARVTDTNDGWQVLVPRTDWAHRLPNRARFEVDKQTGQVSSLPVK